MKLRRTRIPGRDRRPRRFRPCLECLEARLPLTADVVLINFQLAGAPVPTGYQPDTGQVFGPHDHGLTYGWSSDHTDVSRDRNLALDQRLDTLLHFHAGQTWELALANGRYEVTASIGDPEHPSTHTLVIEGVTFWPSTTLNGGQFRRRTQEVTVTDGRLTLDQGTAIEKATRINYLQVIGISDEPNGVPAAPLITEPLPDAAPINPADLHMEAIGYSDPDGNAHRSSDWQVWSVGTSPELVWESLGTSGVERLHTHLGDGFFQNSHAGRTALLANTDYQLRVRYRDDAGGTSQYATRAFTTDESGVVDPPSGQDIPFSGVQPGYQVDVIAEDFRLPVNIAFVPEPGPLPSSPLFYVTELYGTIKVVTRDYQVQTYATDLLNFNPTGNFPGSGEQGLTGIVVDPLTGDVFATRVTSAIPFNDNAPHHPQVLRFHSNDGGLTAASETVILNMVGESQGQSHQISNISFGPDGHLYIHNGDGFDASTAQNLDSYRGKILRLTRDGSAVADNPFHNAADGITARDYVFAQGVRNPFGGAWRASTGDHFSVENGPSIDRLARIDRGANYGWNGSNNSMRVNALYTWEPAHAPVNMTFIESESWGGSGFPESKWDHAFVSESGPTYAAGPQSRGKRIVEFELDAAGQVVSGPTTLVEYTGTGRATIVGLATGPDGLYFTDLYRDLNAATPIDTGARVYRVRFDPGTVDWSSDPIQGAPPLEVQFIDQSSVVGAVSWQWSFGDGGTSTERHPRHTYANAGLFDVTLTVTGTGGPLTRTLWQSISSTHHLVDLNGDSFFDAADALIVFAHWGRAGLGDFNLDGIVDAADAGRLFAEWTTDAPAE